MPVVGSLVRSTAGTWVTRAPTHCPNRHTLGPGEALVGYAHCSHPGGHTTWWCRRCHETVYGPPLTATCSTLVGPCAARLSNQAMA